MRLRPNTAALAAIGQLVEVAVPSPDAALRWIDEHRVVVTDGDVRIRATVYVGRDVTYVSIGGHTFEVPNDDDAAAVAAHAGDEPAAVSPMTGVLAAVHVEPGQSVEAGTPLFVVEAMKMEYVVRAPRDVTIQAVAAAPGDQVDLGAEVVSFVMEASA